MNTPNIESYRAEYERQLCQYQPVEDVFDAERKQEDTGGDRYDTVFHHFMYDYVGDPRDQKRAPLMLREQEDGSVTSYPNRMYFGFTASSKIVLVRCSPEIEFDQPEQFYIVTADLRAGQVAVWSVTELLSRERTGFECYMSNEYGDEAHFELGTQRVRLKTQEDRRPEPVAAMDDKFFSLLEMRRKLHEAPLIGKMLLFMSSSANMRTVEQPATIAA